MRTFEVVSAEAYYLLQDSDRVRGFKDLDDVVLVRAVVARGGHVVAVGTEGTIVGVYDDGSAYEVEFAEPEGTLVTLDARDLKLVRSFEG